MLGLNFLKLFEIDINFEQQVVTFHPVGHIQQGVLSVGGMSRLTCTPLKGGRP